MSRKGMFKDPSRTFASRGQTVSRAIIRDGRPHREVISSAKIVYCRLNFDVSFAKSESNRKILKRNVRRIGVGEYAKREELDRALS